MVGVVQWGPEECGSLTAGRGTQDDETACLELG